MRDGALVSIVMSFIKGGGWRGGLLCAIHLEQHTGRVAALTAASQRDLRGEGAMHTVMCEHHGNGCEEHEEEHDMDLHLWDRGTARGVSNLGSLGRCLRVTSTLAPLHVVPKPSLPLAASLPLRTVAGARLGIRRRPMRARGAWKCSTPAPKRSTMLRWWVDGRVAWCSWVERWRDEAAITYLYRFIQNESIWVFQSSFYAMLHSSPE
jgi:hypothetical protein